MENGIYEKLNDIKDLDERVLLKSILNSVFVSLEDYTKERFDNLEKRVFDEIPYEEAKYNIYCTMVNRHKLDPTDNFMYPILKEDSIETEYKEKDILKALREKAMKKIFKVFLKCDYKKFEDFLENSYEFKGRIETNKKTHIAYFKIRRNNEYSEKVRMLYKTFINNSIKWTTINNPYIHKFADVILTGCEDEIDQDEEIIKIDVDFGEYNSYVKYDMVPLWNIEELKLKSGSFPTPCIDKVNYEHVLSTNKEGSNNGYLVDTKEKDINYVMFRKESIVISTNIDASIKWDILKIVNCDESKIPKYEYELMTNKVNVNFSNKISLEKRYTVKTKSELARVINSFEASKYLKFKEVILEDCSDINSNETYDVNDFIIDEIRDANIKKRLILKFQAIDKDNYINNDILSFLVSEAAFLYPEYKCEGRLI
ncbi:MAG: normocyte-binding protein [Clostridium sp.]